jgi:hypothetical protein
MQHIKCNEQDNLIPKTREFLRQASVTHREREKSSGEFQGDEQCCSGGGGWRRERAL